MWLSRMTLVALAGSVLAVTLAVPAPAATKRPVDRCKPPNTRYKLIVANRVARLYQRGTRGSIVGCAAERGRIRTIAGNYGDCFPDSCVIIALQLAGPYAAWVDGFAGRDGLFTSMRVMDLRSGRVVLTREPGVAGAQPGLEGYVTDFVSTPTLGLAWIGQAAQTGPSVPPYEVHVSDAAGDRVLETGSTIEPGSLAVIADRIYWRAGDEARSATLAGRVAALPGWTRATR
jgi:hypothetical protein